VKSLDTLVKSRPWVAGTAVLALIGVVVEIVVNGSTILGWFTQRAPDVYRVRVIVLDHEGVPADDSKVTSSWGGEPKLVQGGWEFTIPHGTMPISGAVEIYAERPAAFERGVTAVKLAADANVSTTIRMAVDSTAQISGIVLDQQRSAITGARVTVVGHENEAVITGSTGGFHMLAHAPTGKQVQVHVQRTGFRAHIDFYQAGYAHEIILSRE
jgi:hypothetical protein